MWVPPAACSLLSVTVELCLGLGRGSWSPALSRLPRTGHPVCISGWAVGNTDPVVWRSDRRAQGAFVWLVTEPRMALAGGADRLPRCTLPCPEESVPPPPPPAHEPPSSCGRRCLHGETPHLTAPDRTCQHRAREAPCPRGRLWTEELPGARDPVEWQSTGLPAHASSCVPAALASTAPKCRGILPVPSRAETQPGGPAKRSGGLPVPRMVAL